MNQDIDTATIHCGSSFACRSDKTRMRMIVPGTDTQQGPAMWERAKCGLEIMVALGTLHAIILRVFTSTSTSCSPRQVNFSMSGVSLMRYSTGST